MAGTLVPPLDRYVDRYVIRRCPVPPDLAPVTDVGEENGRAVDTDRIWRRVESLYRSGVHPAIQLCIRHRGDVVLDRAIGHARGVRPGRRLDPDRLVPMTVDTPVNLFSAGKAVTAMVMHKLEELGVVDLDATVSTYLPEFSRHDKHEITLRQVLTHRAGIPSLPAEAMDLAILADPDRIEALLHDLRPDRAPGGAPAYHAVTGGFVMEAVTRRVLGRSLRDVLVDEIKMPLGLRWFDFGSAPHEVGDVAENVITGVPLLPPLSLLISRALGTGWDQAVLLSNDPRFVAGVIPSGNVVATARDAATFYECLRQGGALDGVRVFEPDTIARATAADRDGLDLDRMIGLPIRYGAGFMLGSSTISLYGWNHPHAFGHVGLANSFTWADPERQLVVALLTTGKAVFGTHIPALVGLLTEIHRTFPVRA